MNEGKAIGYTICVFVLVCAGMFTFLSVVGDIIASRRHQPLPYSTMQTCERYCHEQGAEWSFALPRAVGDVGECRCIANPARDLRLMITYPDAGR